MREYEGRWRTTPELWDELKPLAREKRRNATPAEARLWQHLRSSRVSGFKFRRQHAIGPFIADFYCARPVLIIEIDGASHTGREDEDAQRQQYIETLGTPVLRFTNDEVLHNLDAVLQVIATDLVRRSRIDSPSLPGGEGVRG